MKRMKIKIISLITLSVLATVGSAYSDNYYISDGGAGAANGTSCGDARDYNWFNNSANWGGGGPDIDPGDTVHVCGWINVAAGATGLTFRGSGTAGNEITLKFENNAALTSSAMRFGVNLNGADNVVVDGGLNGVIQNTDNGTAGSYGTQAESHGVYCLGTCNSVTVKNLTIKDVYVRTSSSDTWVSTTSADGIWIQTGNNILIDNNTVNGTYFGIDVSNVSRGMTRDNIILSNNTVYNSNFGVGVRNWESAKLTNVTISGNHVYDSYVWDNPGTNKYHHDPIYAFNASQDTGSILGLKIYNNRIDGNNGIYSSGWITLGGGVQGEGAEQPMVFNNILDDKFQPPAESFIWGRDRNTGLDQNALIANNVISGIGAGNAIGYAQMARGWHVINNIAIGMRTFIYENTFAECNHNILYDVDDVAMSTNDICTGSEGMQIGVDPMLNSYFFPVSVDSPAVNSGFALIEFNIDADDQIRPKLGFWDVGAYEFADDYKKPNPPSNLTAE